tara:strand:- start:392 stop:592 length:201 start_codon:yes stop_codon:yes gene_type:complete
MPRRAAAKRMVVVTYMLELPRLIHSSWSGEDLENPVLESRIVSICDFVGSRWMGRFTGIRAQIDTK